MDITVRNHQLFLTSVAEKVPMAETLTNPGKISDMVSAVSPYLTLDETLDSGELVSIGRMMTEIHSDELERFTAPTNGVGRARGQSVVGPDEQAIEEIDSALGPDDLASYLAGH